MSPAAPLALTVVQLLGDVYTQPDLGSVASTTSPAWAPASNFAALNGMTKDLIGRVRRKNNPF